MELSFLQPAWALALLALPVLWFVPSGPLNRVQATLRTVVFALAILALTQPVLMTSAARQHVAIALDQSASLTPAARQDAAAAAAEIAAQAQGDDASVRVVQLGGAQPAVDERDRWLRPGATSADGSAGSPLGDALALAAQSIPRGMGGRLVLISDGRATDPHWGKALGAIAARELPVHALPVAAQEDAFLANLRARSTRFGETLRAVVDVVGTGDGLEVALAAGGQTLAQSGAFASGGRRAVELEIEVDAPGFVDVEATLSAPDESGEMIKSRLQGVFVVDEPVRVLYLGERQQGAAEPLTTLLGAGFMVSEAAPADADFRAFDLVVVDDLPARALPEAAQQRLLAAVRDHGVGLLHSGGAAAFSDGGYRGAPLAEALPVELSGEEDKIDPSVGLAIIIDTSGSMGGSRIELAKQIARIAVRRMQPHDRIGIVEFYGAKHWAVPMQPASNKIEIDRAIGRMKAIGGTVLYPAIQEAYYGLRNVNTRYKHILLITDAGVEDSNYEAMVRRIAKDGINVSTILVGQGGHNLIMSDIANWGRGRFYAVGDQFSLVELILKQPATRKPPRYKQGEFPTRALGGRGWWGDAERETPPVLGYVEVEARPGAETLLEALPGGHPLLATWRHGLGRVTAFMTEPVGAGTARWRGWPDYGALLARLLARTAADNPPFALTLTRRHDTLTLSALRTARDSTLVPTAHLVDAAGAKLDMPRPTFREQAPGLFEARFRWPRSEAARVVVAAGGHTLRVAAAPASDARAETQVDPRAGLDLPRLAAHTGGSVLATAADAGALGGNLGELAFVVTRLWPYLLLAALLAYLGEIVYRRWPRTR